MALSTKERPVLNVDTSMNQMGSYLLTQQDSPFSTVDQTVKSSSSSFNQGEPMTPFTPSSPTAKARRQVPSDKFRSKLSLQMTQMINLTEQLIEVLL